MSCDKGSQIVTIYFFENGVACTPERVKKRRFDLERLICKKGKTFTYHGKALYTLRGDPVCSFNPLTLPTSVAYVLVANCETFMCRDYDSTFQKILSEKKSQSRCKSLPSVPIGASDCCPKPRPKPCAPCPPKKTPCYPKIESDCESLASIPPCGQSPCARTSFGATLQQRNNNCCNRPKNSCDCEKKPACQLEESDDCLDCPSGPKINYKCKSRKPPTPMVMQKNKGFLASCCPCCVSEYTCQKEQYRPPTLGCCPNAKLTQTTKEDFQVSRRLLQKAMQEEKRRQSLYSRRRRTQCKQRRDICPPTDDECEEDPKKIMRREKARERYCIKRQKMEQKLTKALEKHYKKC